MSNYACFDSSVLIKTLTWEEGSDEAARLLESALKADQEIILPGFAWVEVGSVLRQKVASKEITPDEAETAWSKFCALKLNRHPDDNELLDLAWRIAVAEKLPTLYDSAYLAVAELAAGRSSDGCCTFWTADDRLINALAHRRDYIKSYRDINNQQSAFTGS
jgi:predicted nucleic acid-binding protein